MNRRPRNWPRENGALGASSLSASASPHSARKAVVMTLRRQGRLLDAVVRVCIDSLIANKDEVAAELLNDTVKPLADVLLHLEIE